MLRSTRNTRPFVLGVLLIGLLLTGCQDAAVDADQPAPTQEQTILAKMQQAFAETGMYAVPEDEYAVFGIELPDVEALAEAPGKTTVCDRARVPFPYGVLVARSCATVKLVQFQGGLYNLITARAANSVDFSTDVIPPRESKVCSVTLRLEGPFIAENDCVAEPHSYYASNAFAALIPAVDGPYPYIRDSQHTWNIEGQLFAATTSVAFKVTPIP